jgi:hypothetical protein
MRSPTAEIVAAGVLAYAKLFNAGVEIVLG